jgi:hypothetical protein
VATKRAAMPPLDQSGVSKFLQISAQRDFRDAKFRCQRTRAEHGAIPVCGDARQQLLDTSLLIHRV